MLFLIVSFIIHGVCDASANEPLIIKGLLSILSIRPIIEFIKHVLPEPVSPKMATSSPFSISKLTSLIRILLLTLLPKEQFSILIDLFG